MEWRQKRSSIFGYRLNDEHGFHNNESRKKKKKTNVGMEREDEAE